MKDYKPLWYSYLIYFYQFRGIFLHKGLCPQTNKPVIKTDILQFNSILILKLFLLIKLQFQYVSKKNNPTYIVIVCLFTLYNNLMTKSMINNWMTSTCLFKFVYASTTKWSSQNTSAFVILFFFPFGFTNHDVL